MSAFDEIYKRYNERLYQFIYNIVKSRDDAEDIVQDVFVKVWQKRQSIDEFLSFKSFIFTISYNTSISLIRKRIKNTDFVEYIKRIQKQGELSENISQIEYNELEKNINKIIDKLPKKQKQVYKLSREKYLSYKDIAVELNISVSTVEKHMVKALKFLKVKLNKLSAVFFILLYTVYSNIYLEIFISFNKYV